jgi:hypothetical protein
LFTLDIGKSEIENDKVDELERGRPDGILAGRGLVDGEPFKLESGAQEPPQPRFIIDDQDDG